MTAQPTVIIVDDDPGTLKGVKRLLREHGYDSVLFPSAKAFQNHDDLEEAFCVILDVDLNDESGIELRHRLKAAGFSVPVIYITASPKKDLKQIAIEEGAAGFFEKPYDAEELLSCIARILRAERAPPAEVTVPEPCRERAVDNLQQGLGRGQGASEHATRAPPL